MSTKTNSTLPTLAVAQVALETSHKELKAARAAFEKAKKQLDLAEASYTNSRVTLNKSVEALQQACHLQPFGL